MTDFAAGTTTRFAEALGDGVFVKGHNVTWSISLAVASHRPGYYNSSTGSTYFVAPGPGMVVVSSDSSTDGLRGKNEERSLTV